jgi:hypothetical protein
MTRSSYLQQLHRWFAWCTATSSARSPSSAPTSSSTSAGSNARSARSTPLAFLLDLGGAQRGDAEQPCDIPDGQTGTAEFGDGGGGLTVCSVAELSQGTAKFEGLEGLVGHLGAIQFGCDVHIERALIDVEHQAPDPPRPSARGGSLAEVELVERWDGAAALASPRERAAATPPAASPSRRGPERAPLVRRGQVRRGRKPRCRLRGADEPVLGLLHVLDQHGDGVWVLPGVQRLQPDR